MNNYIQNIRNIKINNKIFENIEEWNKNLIDNSLINLISINVNGMKTHWEVLKVQLRNIIHDLDVIIIQETKLNYDEAENYKLDNFNQICYCRSSSGGGVMAFIRNTFKIERLYYRLDAAENIFFRIEHNQRKTKFLIMAIYRPPNNDVTTFLQDLQWWLSMVPRKEENIIMAGDINICLLKKSRHLRQQTDYLNILYSNLFVPTISHPTRVEFQAGVQTSSCIDHINIRVKDHEKIVSGVVEEKISDHSYVNLQLLSSLNAQRKINKKKVKEIKIIDDKIIEKEIEKINWKNFNDTEDPEEIYLKIKTNFNKLYEKSSKVILKSEQDDITPWVNKEIQKEINVKYFLFKKWKNNTNNMIFYDEYKKQRNLVTNEIKKQKRIYFFKQFQEARGDMRKTWSVLNKMMERKNREPTDVVLPRNFNTQDIKELAENFNRTFVKQIQDLKKENDGPSLDVEITQEEQQGEVSSFYLRPPTEDEIGNIILDLNKTGPGLDLIRPKDCKKYCYLFIPIFTTLVKQIIKLKKIPSSLKISCVTPIFKNKGDLDQFGSYRAVGSMCFIEKVFEKYIEKQMKKYVKENNILPEFQHGFQAKKSTTTLLEDFSEIMNSALDKRKFVVICMLDLKRAFDTIDHGKMIEKLEKIGVRHGIFKEYFSDRRQVIKIGTTQSCTIPVGNYALIQGAINSPGNYNIYTSDIKYVKLTGQLKMFADDSCLISTHTCLKTAIENSQTDIINIQKYFYNDNIYINEIKTEILVLGTPTNKQEVMSQNKIIIHKRKCLERKTYINNCCDCPINQYSRKVKYLGMFIEDDFKFYQHIQFVCKKLRILSYQLKRNEAATMPMSIKKNLYYALAESLIRYGVTLYASSPQYMISPLNSIQNKIKNYLFQDEDFKKMLLSPQKLSTLLCISNHYEEEKYRTVRDTNYQTRNRNFITPRIYTRYGERLFAYIIPNLLNKYCRDFDFTETKQSISNNLKDILIDEREDY